MSECTWFEDEDSEDGWETACGNSFNINEQASPKESGFMFCPYCGGLLDETFVDVGWIDKNNRLPYNRQLVTIKGIPGGCTEEVEIDITYLIAVGLIEEVTHWKPRKR